MSHATDNLKTSIEAAELLGVTPSRICQICRESRFYSKAAWIGFKMGRDWQLDAGHIKAIRIGYLKKFRK